MIAILQMLHLIYLYTDMNTRYDLNSEARTMNELDLCATLGTTCTDRFFSFEQLLNTMTPAKRKTAEAAVEMYKRIQADRQRNNRIKCSNDIYNEFFPLLSDISNEEFWIMLLDNSLRIIQKVKIGQGGIAETSADVRLIFKAATLALASGLVCIHNHPSGSTRPSSQDDRITENIGKACKCFSMTFIDHVIIGQDKFYSYHDEGKI